MQLSLVELRSTGEGLVAKDLVKGEPMGPGAAGLPPSTREVEGRDHQELRAIFDYKMNGASLCYVRLF